MMLCSKKKKKKKDLKYNSIYFNSLTDGENNCGHLSRQNVIKNKYHYKVSSLHPQPKKGIKRICAVNNDVLYSPSFCVFYSVSTTWKGVNVLFGKN